MLFMVRPDVKAIHRLADLLETIGVTSDELLDLKLPARDLASIRSMDDTEIQSQLAELRKFVGRVRSLELAIVAKLSQARERSRQAARTDWRLRPILMLFTAGTQAFADRWQAEAGDPDRGFDGADQIFLYLRSRGLVGLAASHYDGSTELLVTDGFRLMGVLQMRDLLERCEATLNALDAHYDLYEFAEDEAEDIVESASAPPQVTVAPPAPAADATVNWGDAKLAEPPPGAEVSPSESAIAAANAASEAGLKSLTERLADMKAEPAAEAHQTTPAKDVAAG